MPCEPCLAVVWIVRLEFAEPLFGEMPPGENWHFASAGSPEQLRLTLLLKVFPTSVAVTVYCALLPALTVTLEGEAVSVKSSPLPLSATVCGLPEPLSAMTIAPLAGPPVVGRKLIVMLQFDPLLSDAGQLFDSRNSPVTVMEEITSGPGPLAVSLTLLPPLSVPTIWLEKVRLLGLNVGARSTPLPDSAALTAPLCELLVTVSEPARAPVVEGVKVTLIVQLAPAASGVLQLFVSAKSPVIGKAEIVSGALPVFDSVTPWAGLVVPIT